MFLQLVVSSYGQRQSVCACSPRAVLLTLNFNGFCPPEGILTGSETGIEMAFCSVTEDAVPGLDPSLDLVPVQVTNFNVFELALDMTVMRQTFATVDLSDGDTVYYESFNSSDPSYDPVADIPGGLQVDIKGKNSLGRDITNGFILKYTNRCDVVPFSVGDSIAWLNFTEITPPTGDTCSLYTDAPTASPLPTFVPSSIPTSTPSNVPSDQPSELPTYSPSNGPSQQSSDMPTRTISPSSSPSVIQSGKPTMSPSVLHSGNPTMSRSNSPTNVSSFHPSSKPSVGTDIPTTKPSVFPSGTSSSFPSSQPSKPKTDTPSGSPNSFPSLSPSVPIEEPTSFSMSYSYKLATSEFLSDLFSSNEQYEKPRVEHKAGVAKSAFLSEIDLANEFFVSSQQDLESARDYAERHKVRRKRGKRRLLLNGRAEKSIP